MNVFISGGCKNGKSHHAQNIAKTMADEKNLPLYYLATMIPKDEEDEARVRRHIRERAGMGFDTIERGLDICSCLDGLTSSGLPVDRNGVFLLDSVTALLSNEMFDNTGAVDLDASFRVADQLVHMAQSAGNIVFVSDYIYSDAIIYDSLTESYRNGLAHIDKVLAGICDQVIEVCYGFIKTYK